jgi:uncharacterized protein YjiS (DUF1127 family)
MSNEHCVGGHRPLHPLLAGLADLVHDHMIDPIRRRARSRTGAREMARLDHHLLRDIGLTRPEIHAAAYGLLIGRRANGSASRDTAADQPVPTSPAKVAALVRDLSDHLLHAPTATEALHAWCAARRLSAGPIIAVKQDPDRRRHADDDVLDELRPERHERIAYRCVRLVRGRVVLSEADNWFIPERLPPDVRSALEATDMPFGAAIARLRPSRRTYFVRFPDLSGQRSRDRWPSRRLVAIDAGSRAQGRGARSRPAAAFGRMRTLLRDAPERRRDALFDCRSTRIGSAGSTAIGAVSRLEGDRKDVQRWFRTGSPGPVRRGSCAVSFSTRACGTSSASGRTTS